MSPRSQLVGQFAAATLAPCLILVLIGCLGGVTGAQPGSRGAPPSYELSAQDFNEADYPRYPQGPSRVDHYYAPRYSGEAPMEKGVVQQEQGRRKSKRRNCSKSVESGAASRRFNRGMAGGDNILKSPQGGPSRRGPVSRAYATAHSGSGGSRAAASASASDSHNTQYGRYYDDVDAHGGYYDDEGEQGNGYDEPDHSEPESDYGDDIQEGEQPEDDPVERPQPQPQPQPQAPQPKPQPELKQQPQSQPKTAPKKRKATPEQKEIKQKLLDLAEKASESPDPGADGTLMKLNSLTGELEPVSVDPQTKKYREKLQAAIKALSAKKLPVDKLRAALEDLDSDDSGNNEESREDEQVPEDDPAPEDRPEQNDDFAHDDFAHDEDADGEPDTGVDSGIGDQPEDSPPEHRNYRRQADAPETANSRSKPWRRFMPANEPAEDHQDAPDEADAAGSAEPTEEQEQPSDELDYYGHFYYPEDEPEEQPEETEMVQEEQFSDDEEDVDGDQDEASVYYLPLSSPLHYSSAPSSTTEVGPAARDAELLKQVRDALDDRLDRISDMLYFRPQILDKFLQVDDIHLTPIEREFKRMVLCNANEDFCHENLATIERRLLEQKQREPDQSTDDDHSDDHSEDEGSDSHFYDDNGQADSPPGVYEDQQAPPADDQELELELDEDVFADDEYNDAGDHANHLPGTVPLHIPPMPPIPPIPKMPKMPKMPNMPKIDQIESTLQDRHATVRPGTSKLFETPLPEGAKHYSSKSTSTSFGYKKSGEKYRWVDGKKVPLPDGKVYDAGQGHVADSVSTYNDGKGPTLVKQTHSHSGYGPYVYNQPQQQAPRGPAREPVVANPRPRPEPPTAVVGAHGPETRQPAPQPRPVAAPGPPQAPRPASRPLPYWQQQYPTAGVYQQQRPAAPQQQAPPPPPPRQYQQPPARQQPPQPKPQPQQQPQQQPQPQPQLQQQQQPKLPPRMQPELLYRQQPQMPPRPHQQQVQHQQQQRQQQQPQYQPSPGLQRSVKY